MWNEWRYLQCQGLTTADCCHLTSGSNNSSYDSCFPIQGEYFSRFMSSLSFTRAKYFPEICLVYLSSQDSSAQSNLNECSNSLKSSLLVGSDRSSRNASLRSFVRSSSRSSSFWPDSLQEHSESIKQAFREQSDCVIPSEPKILRLVGKYTKGTSHDEHGL